VQGDDFPGFPTVGGSKLGQKLRVSKKKKWDFFCFERCHMGRREEMDIEK
jgi:hypothetical protein